MRIDDGAIRAGEPSRRRTLAVLAGAMFAGGAATWPTGGGNAAVPAVPAGNGALLWTADVQSAQSFGPVTAERLLLVERPFTVRGRQAATLSCLDAVTGRRLWSAQLAPPLGAEQKVIVSASVVLVRTKAALQALDLHSGRPLWRHQRNTAGSGLTIVTAGADLVLDSGQDDNAAANTTQHAVEAYEIRNGRLRWGATVQPTVVTAQAPIHAAGLLIGAATAVGSRYWRAFVYALDAATGQQRWWRPTRKAFEWTPKMPLAYAGGTVYVSLDGRSLVALDAATGTVRWHSRFDLRTEQSSDDPGDRPPDGADIPVIAGDTAYLCCADGVLRAFDTRDGRQRWAFGMSEKPAAMWLPPSRPRPLIGNDLVYVTSRGTAATDHRSTMHVLDAADGRPRWRRPAYDSTGGPIMAGGALYVPGGTAITAYDPSDGTVRRRLDLKALDVDGTTELLTDGTRLYILTNPGVLALSLAD